MFRPCQNPNDRRTLLPWLGYTRQNRSGVASVLLQDHAESARGQPAIHLYFFKVAGRVKIIEALFGDELPRDAEQLSRLTGNQAVANPGGRTPLWADTITCLMAHRIVQMSDLGRWVFARTKQEMPTGGEFLMTVDRIIEAFG
jgi:hypothetical protein